MEFDELIKKRYSARDYKSIPVEDEKVQAVLEAGRLAPTAANRQPIRFIVIHTEGREKELRRIYKGSFFTKAPVVICVCAIPSFGWTRKDGKNYCDIDATIAMDYLILAATNLGLGTCWIAAFDPHAAREVLGLPNGIEPIAFTTLGYALDKPQVKKRKKLSELCHKECW